MNKRGGARPLRDSLLGFRRFRLENLCGLTARGLQSFGNCLVGAEKPEPFQDFGEGNAGVSRVD